MSVLLAWDQEQAWMYGLWIGQCRWQHSVRCLGSSISSEQPEHITPLLLKLVLPTEGCRQALLCIHLMDPEQ